MEGCNISRNTHGLTLKRKEKLQYLIHDDYQNCYHTNGYPNACHCINFFQTWVLAYYYQPITAILHVTSVFNTELILDIILSSVCLIEYNFLWCCLPLLAMDVIFYSRLTQNYCRLLTKTLMSGQKILLVYLMLCAVIIINIFQPLQKLLRYSFIFEIYILAL